MPGAEEFEQVELNELSTKPKETVTPFQTDFLSDDYLMEVEEGGEGILFISPCPLRSSKDILGVSLLAATGTAAAMGETVGALSSTTAAATAVGPGATSTAATVTAVGSLTA